MITAAHSYSVSGLKIVFQSSWCSALQRKEHSYLDFLLVYLDFFLVYLDFLLVYFVWLFVRYWHSKAFLSSENVTLADDTSLEWFGSSKC